MANFRRARLVAILGLAACSANDKGESTIDAPSQAADAPTDSKTFMDAPAPSYDFSCASKAAPTTAAATVTLSGNVQQLDLQGTTPSSTPIASADIALCKERSLCNSGATFIRSVATDAQGNFSHSTVSTGSVPFDVHLKLTKENTSTRTTYVFPPAPFVADQAGIPIVAFGAGLMTALTVACSQNDATNAIVALVVTDCKGTPITDTKNVHISINQGGSSVATINVFDLGDVSAQFAGTFFVCNVPANNATTAGATTVGATYKATVLKDTIVRVAAGATTQTILRPGY